MNEISLGKFAMQANKPAMADFSKPNISMSFGRARPDFLMSLYGYNVAMLEREMSKEAKGTVERNFAKNIGKTAEQLAFSGVEILLELAQLHKMMPFLKQFEHVYIPADVYGSSVEKVDIKWSESYLSCWDHLDPRIIYYIENTIKPERAKAGVCTKDNKYPDRLNICARAFTAKFTDVFVEVLYCDLLSLRLYVELKAEELPGVNVTNLPVPCDSNDRGWELRPISEVIAKDFYPESLISLFAPGKAQKKDLDIVDILIRVEQSSLGEMGKR